MARPRVPLPRQPGQADLHLLGARQRRVGRHLVERGPQTGAERHRDRPEQDRRERRAFGLTTGTPVIVVGTTAYSTSRPIRLTRYVYRADRVRLAHEVPTIPEKCQDAVG